MINATGSPTISQLVYQMNNPQTVNFNVGTANIEASSASAGTVVTDAASTAASSVGCSCGGAFSAQA